MVGRLGGGYIAPTNEGIKSTLNLDSPVHRFPADAAWGLRVVVPRLVQRMEMSGGYRSWINRSQAEIQRVFVREREELAEWRANSRL